MSRIGNTPIKIPQEVTLTIDNHQVTVKGPKGELKQTVHNLVDLKQEEDSLVVTRKNETKMAKSLHGTMQRLLDNMVVGVTKGYQKNLELVGTGYRVNKQGNKIVLSLGYSHQIEYQWPEGITVEVEGNNKISVSGIDKQVVGQTAATIRGFKPPEPYKGKGIKYDDEIIRRKAGKAAKA